MPLDVGSGLEDTFPSTLCRGSGDMRDRSYENVIHLTLTHMVPHLRFPDI